jgi:hypothetical protein
MLGLLAQIIEHALVILPNMLAVLAAALASVLVVSFFLGRQNFLDRGWVSA